MSSRRILTHHSAARPVQAGFSLIELIVFIVIVSVALAGVLLALNTVTKSSADPLIRKQMLTIAEALLDEVQMRPFTYCSPEDANASTATTATDCATMVQIFGHKTGSGRAEFDNVGNYCSETGTTNTTCSAITLGTVGSASSQIEDLTGTSANSPLGYWASISLTAQDLDDISSTATAAGLNAILITVEVGSAHSDETIVLQGYRSRWAPRT